MFKFLSRLIGGSESASKPPTTSGANRAVFAHTAPVLQRGEAAPSASKPDTAPEPVAKHSVVCREAVLNRQQRVAGYEFMLRQSIQERASQSGATLEQVYAEVLLRQVAGMKLERVLGQRLAFVKIPVAMIGNKLLAELPGAGMVLMFAADELLAAEPGAILDSMAQLKTLGQQIGILGYVANDTLHPMYEAASIVLLDAAQLDLAALAEQARALERTFPAVRLGAKNIDSLELFQVCAKLPFQYFQGPFVTSRENWASPRTDGGRLQLLKILNRIRQGAETAEVVELFKQEPVLSYKLLRYINSPAGGLVTKAASVEQALMLLGQQKLFRWLTMLLFISGEAGELDYALLDNAVVRARLTELLGKDRLPRNEAENLFVAGMFSLLDVLLRMPMQTALAQVTLPEPVAQAILSRQGPLAPYLALAIACEEMDQAAIAQYAANCGLSEVQVNTAHMDALAWANGLDQQAAGA